MSRKDSKGRVLKSNEFQRADGRYEYKYTDRQGKRRSVYSWRLIDSDKVPQGKRKCKPLRTLEKEVEDLLNNNINISKAQQFTLNDYFYRNLEGRQIKERTKYMYQLEYDKHIKPRVGNKKMLSINKDVMTRCYSAMIEEDGLSLCSVNRAIAMLNPVFKEAMFDNVLNENPNVKMKSDLRSKYGRVQTITEVPPLSIDEERELLSFIKEHPTHSWIYPLVFFMLRTGCRFSEARALTWDDVNFEEHYISINHIFNQTPEKGWFATSPKTKSSIRNVPMIPELESLLREILERQIKNNIYDNYSIDGYEHLVFLTLHGDMFINQCTGRKLKAITESYNKERSVESGITMPSLATHMFRHTYCTRLCENNVNVKTIQSIMGHSNIAITLDIYTKISEKKKLEDIKRVNFGFFESA